MTTQDNAFKVWSHVFLGRSVIGMLYSSYVDVAAMEFTSEIHSDETVECLEY